MGPPDEEDEMSLTIHPGPLAGKGPGASGTSGTSGTSGMNYRIDGPAHRLHLHPFPRRVRAEFAGRTVLDTVRGELLHETGLRPVLYVPLTDLNAELLEETDHTTHCPFKGDAAYRSVRAGDRVAENAVWTYPEPTGEAAWLEGYAAVYWSAMDAWYDEDERVDGLCDPFHRVDVRASSRRVVVRPRGAAGEVIAEAARPWLLSETGLPNRFYLPLDAVRPGVLEPSPTRSHCPYKGDATYWSVRIGDRLLEDAAWSYPEPIDGAARIKGALSFDHEALIVEVDAPASDLAR